MSFNPPFALRNRHVQTIFSSVGPRRAKVRAAFKAHRASEQPIILSAGADARLAAIFNQSAQQPSSQLVVLIHGWEGSADSTYMLSMATSVLGAGVDVLRLNLLDHGDTHHLNRAVFNSTMLGEVVAAIADLQQRFNYSEYVLGGFSLGGNFCCRVAAVAHEHPIKLAKVVVFCPLLHARETSAELASWENRFYDQYFVHKWKRSLRKKLEHFPEYGYAQEISALKTLDQMNQKLIPAYTPYADLEEYFEAYAITGDRLSSTICPLYLHFSMDDMIIPSRDVEKLAKHPDIHVTVTRYGGHCGFLMNWRLDSWQDARMLELLGK